MAAPDRPTDRAEFRQLLVETGMAMVAAGDAVDLIEESLRRIVAAYGVDGIRILLLPTSLFVQDGSGTEARVEFSAAAPTMLRLDQIDALYRVVKDLEKGSLAPADGLDRKSTRLNSSHVSESRMPSSA